MSGIHINMSHNHSKNFTALVQDVTITKPNRTAAPRSSFLKGPKGGGGPLKISTNFGNIMEICK